MGQRSLRVSRDLRRLLDALELNVIGDPHMKIIELQEQLEDSRQMLRELRGENRVLRDMLVARDERKDAA